MTLLDRIRSRIEDEGALTIAEYMEMALADPEEGYYTSRTPLGLQGDFVTAPEISQIFGEMLGIWCAEVWHMLGKPEMDVLEFGPGMGTLMDDFLRATRKVAGFHEAISVQMVELSPVLRGHQQELLQGKHPRIHWHTHMPESERPWLVIGNEFFDALPIRQFRATEAGFCERMVSLAEDGQGLAFAWENGESSRLPGDFPRMVAGELPVDTIIEICPDAQETLYLLAQHIAEKGGAALFVDYGYTRPEDMDVYAGGDTFQAVKRHEFHDVLETPGEADLTAHVDFSTLADIAVAAGCYTPPVLNQRDFLLRMGAVARLENLLAQARSEAIRKTLSDGFNRLIDKNEMGELFKVLAVMPAGIPAPIFTCETGEEDA